MLTAIVLVCVLAYAAIALEHPLNVNKSASALLGAGLLWTLYAVATATDKARPNYPPSAWLEKAKWPVTTMADDSKYTASTAFGLNAFPYFVAINAQGKVTQRATGELTTQQFEALIASAKGS